MRILIAGGKGFIGRKLVEYAENLGHSICVTDYECDVFTSNGENYARDVMSHCDAMILLAARRPISKFDMDDYVYNIRLAEKYLDIARDADLKNVVIASSRSVYSGKDIPWKESSMQAPLSLYGAAKQAVDSIALLYNEQYDMKIKCLRLAQVMGLEEHKGFLLNTLIDNAVQKKKQTVYGQGVGKKQFIYMTDVCRAFLHFAVKGTDHSGVYNIGMDHNISIIDLAYLVNKTFDNDAGVEIIESAKEDKNLYLMDVSKAENELGWKAVFDVEKALLDMKKLILED